MLVKIASANGQQLCVFAAGEPACIGAGKVLGRAGHGEPQELRGRERKVQFRGKRGVDFSSMRRILSLFPGLDPPSACPRPHASKIAGAGLRRPADSQVADGEVNKSIVAYLSQAAWLPPRQYTQQAF